MNLLWIAAAVGGIGLTCLVVRRTLLGVLIGAQLIILGATLMFVLTGIGTGHAAQGQVYALFTTMGGVAQLVAGTALAIRLFYLKRRTSLDDLKGLKE